MPDMFIPYETPYCDESDGCPSDSDIDSINDQLDAIRNGDFPVILDLWIPASAFIPDETSIDNDNGWGCVTFSPGNDIGGFMPTIEFPPAWNTFNLSILWQNFNGGTDMNPIRWQLNYGTVNIGEVTPSFTIGTPVDAAPAGVTTLTKTVLLTVSPTKLLTASRLIRLGTQDNNNDTMAVFGIQMARTS